MAFLIALAVNIVALIAIGWAFGGIYDTHSATPKRSARTGRQRTQ